MRKISLILIFLFAINALPFAAQATPPGDGWDEAIAEDRITIHTKKFPDHKYNDYFTETIIDAPLKFVVMTLRAGNTAEFVEKFIESKVLERPSKTTYLLYIAMDNTLGPRDMVQFGQLSRADDGSIKLSITNRPDAYPEQKGRTRIQKMQQSWTLTALEGNRTRLTQHGYSDPNVSWMFSGMVNDRIPLEIFEIVSDIRDEIEARYKDSLNQAVSNTQ